MDVGLGEREWPVIVPVFQLAARQNFTSYLHTLTH